MIQYACIWGQMGEPFGNYDPAASVETIEFFTTDAGYDEDDINTIKSLECGETWKDSTANHWVIRLN